MHDFCVKAIPALAAIITRMFFSSFKFNVVTLVNVRQVLEANVRSMLQAANVMVFNFFRPFISKSSDTYPKFFFDVEFEFVVP